MRHSSWAFRGMAIISTGRRKEACTRFYSVGTKHYTLAQFRIDQIQKLQEFGRTKELEYLYPQHEVYNICSNRIYLFENEQG